MATTSTTAFSLVALLQVVALATADIFTPGGVSINTCTSISDAWADYYCVEFHVYPLYPDLKPFGYLYDHNHLKLSESQLVYNTAQSLDSTLSCTVDVTANYTSSLDGTEWVDNSNFWYAGFRYGAYDTDADQLPYIEKDGSNSWYTAAYWFNGTGSCYKAASSTASASASRNTGRSGMTAAK